jgi:hypothetical protein
MGSKPSTKSADQANRLAQQQADEARAKEVLRQQHLDTGYSKIQNIFEGSPVMGTKSQKYDWSSFQPSTGTGAVTRDSSGNFVKGGGATGVPAGYTAIQVDDPNYKAPTATGAVGGGTPATVTAKKTGLSSNLGTGYGDVGGTTWNKDAPTYGQSATSQTAGQAAQGGPNKVWAFKDGAGNIIYQGQDFSYDTEYDTGQRKGGFDDAFYEGIAQDVRNLGNEDIGDQYDKARENLQYALARQGISSSSAGNQGAVDVEAAKTKAQGDLDLQAQDAKAQVKSAVDQEKQAAISQLYATEDPTLAANTATSKFQNIQADRPAYSGLGDIFGSVIGGFGNVYNAARNSGWGGFGQQVQPKALGAGGK